MNYNVIIATKDRIDNCTNFVKSLIGQSLHPTRLILVDASQEAINLEEIILSLLVNTMIEFVYQRTQPGLTRQRNLGLKYISLKSEIIFFFDDDIILIDKYYIEKILRRFSMDKKNEIGSIFGKIINSKQTADIKKGTQNIFRFVIKKIMGILSRFFLVSSSKAYHVLPSGMNVSNQEKAAAECYVDWQPGCSMSFRREVLEKYQFDESLVGYSMREDLDMSYRVSKEYKILYLPSAQILHLESPIQRLNAVNFGEKDIESWRWFIWKNMNTVKKKFLFYWSVTGYLILLLLSSILSNDKNAFYRFKGGLIALSRILGLQNRDK